MQLGNRLKREFWPIGLLILAPSFLLPFIDSFPFRPGSSFSDFAISHYPNALYLQRMIFETGQVPLWSNLILGGYPFFANPLSGLWYPPGWLALLFPLPSGLNITVFAHLVLGGIGMFLLLRQQGRSNAASLAGALVFQLAPKLLAHYGAGHVTLIYAINWTPWLLWAQKKAVAHRRDLIAGVVFALIILADVRWALFAGVLWAGWLASILFERPENRKSIFAGWIGNVLIAVCLSAPLLIPLAEYSSLSTRSELQLTDNLAFSLPTSGLLGMFLATTKINPEWVLFPGVTVLVLVSYGIGKRNFWYHNRGWILLIAGSLVFALGSNFPLVDLIFQFPGFSSLRVPARSLYLLSIGFAVLTAWVVDEIRERVDLKSLIGSILFGLLLFSAGFILVLIQEQDVRSLLLSSLGPLIGLTACLLLLSRKFDQKIWLGALIISIFIEGIFFASKAVEFRPTKEVLRPSEIQSGLPSNAKSELFRIYSPSYSIPQEIAAYFKLQLTDGVDPLQLSIISKFMEKASGVKLEGYSVTLPPYKTGNPAIDNKNAQIDVELFKLLSVRYIISAYEIDRSGLSLLAHNSDQWLYELRETLPRAWVEVKEGDPSTIKRVESIINQPNLISIHALGPGRLVISEVIYPGWEAWVDGISAEIHPAYDVLRSIPLTEGKHTIVMEFKPKSLYYGMALCFLALLFLVVNRWIKR